MNVQIVINRKGDYIPEYEYELINSFIKKNNLKDVTILLSILPVVYPSREGDIIILKKVESGPSEGTYLAIAKIRDGYKKEDLENFLITIFERMDEIMSNLISQLEPLPVTLALSNRNPKIITSKQIENALDSLDMKSTLEEVKSALAPLLQ